MECSYTGISIHLFLFILFFTHKNNKKSIKNKKVNLGYQGLKLAFYNKILRTDTSINTPFIVLQFTFLFLFKNYSSKYIMIYI